MKSTRQTMKEKPCYLYIDEEPITSYRDVIKKISSKEIPEKEEALKEILGSMVNDDNYPQDLMINVIHHLTIVDDINVKKLLFLFWEVIDKHKPDGSMKDEIILVCNGIRKDLDSPNEYIRGRTLRLLTKLPYKEILENVKAAVFDNIKHTHPYVKSNAIMCILSFIDNFGVDIVPDSLPDDLKDIIVKDTDTATRRNAYVLYSRISPMESLSLTQEIMENNEISELGDLFALCIVENLRKLNKIFPQKSSTFIHLLLELSVHKSHSVLFEIGSLLLEISSNPNIVSSAVNILCSLLHEERDNNTLIIILKKLYGIKNRHGEILQEQILTFANLINLNYAIELRKLSFELIDELISESTITHVFDKFINIFTQLNSVNESEFTIDLKNSMLKCMLKNIIKFPEIDKLYPLFVLEKNLTFKKDKLYVYGQINSIRELFTVYSKKDDEKCQNIIKEMLNKIIKLFEEIDQYEIMETCIWSLANYSNELPLLKQTFDLVMKNLGDLDFERENDEIVENPEESGSKSDNTKKTITKTVVLPDGTYGTVTQILDVKEIKKQKEIKYLRRFLLETTFYFSANLVSGLTNIIFKMKKLGFDKYNIYYFNAINIICSILKMNSKLVYKDPDNTNHIQMCLKFLLTNNDTIYEEWNQYMQKYENSLKIAQDQTKKEEELVLKKNKDFKNNQPDDFISFRHCKMYDPDNFDVDDDDTLNTKNKNLENDDEEDNIEEQNSIFNSITFGSNRETSSKKRRFIEVLSGTEDPLFVESVVNIYTFDLSIEFTIKNRSKNALQNVSLQLFVPKEFSIIEKPPVFSLEPNETVHVRSCVKFTKTVNAYIFGQISFNNFKGENSFMHLSGLFIELLSTYKENISDLDFRKNWNDYTWEHNVMIVSRKKSFSECINELIKGLKMTLVFPKTIDLINDEYPFMVANLFAKTRLGENALVNISVEKSKDNKIIGTCVIRSKTKDFMTGLGEKIKALIS
jgi:coatomer subunit beta